jgi:preprotein translocase subunit SecG
MTLIKPLLEIVIIAVVLGVVGITLSLNTKSEGLGAAITGASDTYRGAVGIEEQKRLLLRTLCYTFVALALIHALASNFF